jgi:hypothetical protein
MKMSETDNDLADVLCRGGSNIPLPAGGTAVLGPGARALNMPGMRPRDEFSAAPRLRIALHILRTGLRTLVQRPLLRLLVRPLQGQRLL